MQRWPSPIKNLSAEDMRESISHCRLIVPTTSGREIPGKEPSTNFFGFFELLTLSIRHVFIEKLGYLVSG